MLVLKNVGIKVEIKYEVMGREVTETWVETCEASTPENILERICKNPRYPQDAQIYLYF